MEPELEQAAAEVETQRDWHQFVAIWRGEVPLPAEVAPIAEVRAGNLVVEGLLRGVPQYVVRPTPATEASPRRLRSRSFRAAVLSELLGRRVIQQLGLACLFHSPGRFLLAGPPATGWEETLHSLQREFDAWLFQQWPQPGDLECDLAGALCEGEQLPWSKLAERLRHRRRQPLEGALRIGLRWNGGAFVMPAGADTGLCSGCAIVTPVEVSGAEASGVEVSGEEKLCKSCAADEELGARLPGIESAWVCPEPEADLPGPGLGLKFSPESGAFAPELRLDGEHWPLLRRLPARNGHPVSFQQLAQDAGGGKKFLGYLRADVDRLGPAFAALAGEPARAVALSRLLDGFFGEHLRQLLERDFPLLFPFFGGSNGLLLIGPWKDALDLALRLRQDFHALVGDGLTFTAGLSLLPPHASLSTGMELATEAMRQAKNAGGNRLHAFGTVMEWTRVASLLETAKAVAGWLQRRAVSRAWLRRVADGCVSSRSEEPPGRALLAAAVRDPRVKHRPARAWAARLLKDGEKSDRPWIEFLVRYASLEARAAGN